MNIETIKETTDQASQIIKRLQPIWQEVEQLFTEHLTPKQKNSLIVILRSIEQIMKDQTDKLISNKNELNKITNTTKTGKPQ